MEKQSGSTAEETLAGIEVFAELMITRLINDPDKVKAREEKLQEATKALTDALAKIGMIHCAAGY